MSGHEGLLMIGNVRYESIQSHRIDFINAESIQAEPSA